MQTNSKTRVAVIIATTRPTRFADKPATWIFDLAQKREDWDVELVDIRDFDLPFFDEMASNLWMPSKNAKAVAWQKKIASFDGFIIVTAEYNRSIPASLKNALDQAYVEWNHKPMAVLGYGTTGAARAIEHLRTIAVELQMVPVRSAVHLLGADFIKVHPMGENAEMNTVEANLLPSATAMFNDLDWWLDATISAREEVLPKAA